MKTGVVVLVGFMTVLFMSPLALAQKDKMKLGEALGGKVIRGTTLVQPIVTTGPTGPGVNQGDKMHMGEGLTGKTLPPPSSPVTPQVVRPTPVTTGTPNVFPLGVVQGSKPGIVNVSSGDLKGQKIPATISAALGFLIRWGGGTQSVPPVDLNPATEVQIGGVKTPLKNTTLQLPVHGLSVVDETATLAHVKVAQMSVKSSAGVARGVGVLTLTRASKTGTWRVSHVLVQ